MRGSGGSAKECSGCGGPRRRLYEVVRLGTAHEAGKDYSASVSLLEEIKQHELRLGVPDAFDHDLRAVDAVQVNPVPFDQLHRALLATAAKEFNTELWALCERLVRQPVALLPHDEVQVPLALSGLRRGGVVTEEVAHARAGGQDGGVKRERRVDRRRPGTLARLDDGLVAWAERGDDGEKDVRLLSVGVVTTGEL